MAEFLSGAVVVIAMMAIVFYSLYILWAEQELPAVSVLLPVDDDTPVELLLQRALLRLDHLSGRGVCRVILLNLGSEAQTARRLELLQRDHPYLLVSGPAELGELLFNR